MSDNNYLDNAKALVNYFKHIEKYKEYLHSPLKHDEVFYLYSEDYEFNIICISQDKKNIDDKTTLLRLEKKMTKSKHHQPKILIVFLKDENYNNNSSQFVKSHILEVKTNIDQIKNELNPYFARINSLKIISNNNLESNSKSSNVQSQSDIPHPHISAIEKETTDDKTILNTQVAKKEIESFLKDLAPNKLIITWFFSFFFFVIPVFLLVVSLFLHLEVIENSGYFGVIKLATGATTNSLTIRAGQWWRIFSYGFAASSSYGFIFNLFILFLAGLMVYRLLRFSEVAFGIWKTTVSVLAAYICTGFFMSVMGTNVISGGILPILGILIGVILIGIGSIKKPVFFFIRSKLIWPVFLLIMIPLFTGEVTDYQALLIGLAFGSCFMGLFNANITGTKVSISVFAFVLFALLLIPILFWVIPNDFDPAFNSIVSKTLEIYKQHGILSEFRYNEIHQILGWKR